MGSDLGAETFGIPRASGMLKGEIGMPESRTTSTAVAIRMEPARAWAMSALQLTSGALDRGTTWARETAQEFGALVSALMGPAVFLAYAFAIWSLSANFGWTDSFVFSSGPLSNWLVWLAVAISVNAAATILRRRTKN
jgi:hypothetical protein